MSRPISQACPNCNRVHDVSVYVSGQRVLCSCGIHFEVKRNDVRSDSDSKAPNPAVGSDPDTGQEPTLTPSSAQRKAQGDAAAAPVPSIPGYELTELIGKGGMGEVWRARQLSLQRMVAVKLLPPRLAKDPEFVARFDKEATALASLSHPNITQIIDRGVSGDHYYFVMELIAGKTLREVISTGRPVPSEALKIAVQIAKAIEHAHQMKVIHRDLKPENILIDEGGHVKVVDFGLAGMRGSNRDVALTATAVAMGTVNYMAPEQRRDAKNVDHRADIYSLGVILYELLTGELPIGRFRLPSERIRGLDPRLDEIVAKALENEVDARPARAAEISAALEPLMSTASTAALESTPMARPTVPSHGAPASTQPPSYLRGRSVPLWVLLVGVLAGMGLLGAGVKLWPSGTEDAREAKGPEWYVDTEDDLFATAKEEKGVLQVSFTGEGAEELNAHAGMWKAEDGAMKAVQYGAPTLDDHPRLVPRLYVAHRYFSADDVTIEADVEVADLPDEFPKQKNPQRYAEVAFRIKDTQVSVFAMPDEGMRINWRYVASDGTEQMGSSDRDVESLTADSVRVPTGRFHVKLMLSKSKGGAVKIEARVNDEKITRKVLPGLSGTVGKIALGCRNLSCTFSGLQVAGKAVERPKTDKGAQ